LLCRKLVESNEFYLTFRYGAGKRTGILNVEQKLAKALDKQEGVLVVNSKDRDKILSEISARAARYEKWDPEMHQELLALRQDVKDIFNKGQVPGDDVLEELYFLDSKTLDLVEKMSGAYEKRVTPKDFQLIAQIMSENLESQVPVLREFTRFHGRLAEDFMINAKPKESDIDYVEFLKTKVLGTKKAGYKLPKRISEMLGWKDEVLSEKVLKQMGWYKPDSTLAQMLYGVEAPKDRLTGFKMLQLEPFQIKKLFELEIGIANKMPKNWVNVPSVNFDGKIIEQNFTQVFEERLNYKDAEGKWVTNILQIAQKTDPTWWEELINKDGKINSIADTGKARTAYAVNANHSKYFAVNKLH